jgi:hypothetical protein
MKRHPWRRPWRYSGSINCRGCQIPLAEIDIQFCEKCLAGLSLSQGVEAYTEMLRRERAARRYVR